MNNQCTPCAIGALVPVRISVSYPSPEDYQTPMEQALKIKANVCRYYHLTEEELTGKCRIEELVRARHVGMYLTDQLLKGHVSLKVIGWMYGGRDHTTVINAVNSITYSLETGRITPDELQAVVDGVTGPERITDKLYLNKETRKFDPQDVTQMISLKKSGRTLRQIAKQYGVSIGTIHKLTKGVSVKKMQRPKACYSAGHLSLIDGLLQTA